MSEDIKQPESNDQTEEEEVNPKPDQPEHEGGLTDVNEQDGFQPGTPSEAQMVADDEKSKEAPEPGNEKDTSVNVKDADVPWDVVQAQECLPPDEKAVGFFMFNGNPVLVCGKGMYGKHEGTFQRLPVKVLVDNV